MNNPRVTQLICRTCLKVINENELYIDSESPTMHGGTVRDMLETCVSELNLDFSDSVVMCYDCYIMLRISYEFKLKCLNTEDKVFGYLKEYDLPIFSKIDLGDVIVNNNDSNIIDLSDEKRDVATGDKEIVENLTYSLDKRLMKDMHFSRKESSPYVAVTDCTLYKDATGLNTSENTSKRDKDGILMFDSLTNTALDDMLRNNYSVSPVEESDPYRNIDTFFRSKIKKTRCALNLKNCRSNLNNEAFCDCLCKMPPSGTTELNEGNNIEQFVFRTPLIPQTKRKLHTSNSL